MVLWMRRHIIIVLLAVVSAFFAASCLFDCARAADAFQTSVRSAILIDLNTNTILFEKAPDEVMAPASLSKLMTLIVVFSEIKQGRLSLEQEAVVSTDAWRRGGAPSRGSAMYLVPNSRVKVSDLIKGVIIHSGNDASIVLAETIAGTESNFVALMNRKATEMGLTRSTFGNVTGLNDPNNRSNARDLAKMAEHIIREYPDMYALFAEREFTWNNIKQASRNPLLALNIGADGLKTGYLEESGYGLVGSAVQNGQRLILVALGAKTIQERQLEARKILEWGFRAFESRNLFADNEVIGSASVYGGALGSVPVTAGKGVVLLFPRGNVERLSAKVVYRGPIVAPVRKGQAIGSLQVMRGNQLSLEVPVFAAEDVGAGTLRQRAFSAAVEMTTQIIRSGLAR